MKLVIKNARIINPDQQLQADILIQNGVIDKIGKISEKADKEIEAQGKIVFPGLIDMHTHIRTPGQEDREDLESASRAAAKGGFTSICCMPNTVPAVDNETTARWIYDQARKIGLVDMYPVGAISKQRQGKELSEFCALRRAGCLSLSDDGDSVKDPSLLRKALEYSRMSGLLLISHCEDKNLSGKGVMRESSLSAQYGMTGIPSISESIIVARDIELARYLNTPIHLAHISTVRSLELIHKAKQEGVQVTCETAPHYCVLSLKDVVENGFDSRYKVNPPLGEESDVAAVRQALQSGVIDCIATDHAPHLQGEKELPFQEAPFGFIGLEWAFSLLYTFLVKEKIISLPLLVDKMSSVPARILKLEDKGLIREGNCADLVIADPDRTWTVTEDTIASKSRNTPFIGYTLSCCIEYTIHRGKISYKNV